MIGEDEAGYLPSANMFLGGVEGTMVGAKTLSIGMWKRMTPDRI